MLAKINRLYKPAIVILYLIAILSTIWVVAASYQYWQTNKVIEDKIPGSVIRQGDLDRAPAGSKKERLTRYTALSIVQAETDSPQRTAYYHDYFEGLAEDNLSTNEDLRTALEDALIWGHFYMMSPDDYEALESRYLISSVEEGLTKELATIEKRREASK